MGPLNLHVGPWPLCQPSAQQWSQLPAPRGVSTLTPGSLALSLPSHRRFFPILFLCPPGPRRAFLRGLPPPADVSQGTSVSVLGPAGPYSLSALFSASSFCFWVSFATSYFPCQSVSGSFQFSVHLSYFSPSLPHPISISGAQ